MHLGSKQIVSALHHQHVIWMILYFLLSSSKGCYFMWLVCWDKQFQENWSNKWTKRKVVLRKRNQWHCTFSLERGGETTNSVETLQLAKFHARNYTECGISFKATNIIITFRCAQEKYLIAEFMHMSSFATTYYISRGLVFCDFFFLLLTFQTARKYVCFQQFGKIHAFCFGLLAFQWVDETKKALNEFPFFGNLQHCFRFIITATTLHFFLCLPQNSVKIKTIAA